MAGMVNASIFGSWDLTAGKAETDDQRFTSFVERNSRFVFRVTFAILRNTADAEDAAQETFLKLYRLRAWQAAQDERAFLARAAWRVAISRKRRVTLDDVPEQQCLARNPEEAAIAADQDAWLHRLIDALPEELRVPLALSSVDGLTSTEIGIAMGLTGAAVRSRLAGARQILRKKIEERYGTRRTDR